MHRKNLVKKPKEENLGFELDKLSSSMRRSRSRDFFACIKSIEDSDKLLFHKHQELASEKYMNARTIYIGLDYFEKKELYHELKSLYEKLKGENADSD